MGTSQLTIDVLLTEQDRRRALVEDACRGLSATPKALSPLWFYDERGSRLFDEITRLPEYYLTRSERTILDAHASAIASAARAETLVELGSGTSAKTRVLLGAMRMAGVLRHYVPLDVSAETLRASAIELAQEYEGLVVHAVVGDFHRHLAALPRLGRRLFAFLGSTIGNLAPIERSVFLGDLRRALGRDDSVLLGVDLVKDPHRLVAAYDDSAGVTAAFNKNALAVLNEALGADFALDRFHHEVRWDARRQWIEMHLRAGVAHVVRIRDLGLDVSFDRGETIRTEISAKFTRAGICTELATAGLTVEETWDDRDNFLVLLARPSR